ncbi:MAG: CsiV family protein, partial [Pseudomonadota bacterium]
PSETWYVEPSLLTEQLSKLSENENYEVMHYYSWGQESLPFSQSASMSFYEDSLKGWVKIYAKTLLYINLDLDLDGFRMNEKRRVKLNEKHFFDHPKFGVLMQVSRLEYPEPEAEPMEEQGLESNR